MTHAKTKSHRLGPRLCCREYLSRGQRDGDRYYSVRRYDPATQRRITLWSGWAASVQAATAYADVATAADLRSARDVLWPPPVAHGRKRRWVEAAGFCFPAHGSAFVYYIADDRWHVKIGTTQDVRSRVSAIQTAHRWPVVLLAVEVGGVDVERQRHHEHKRLAGEWFAFDDGLQQRITEVNAANRDRTTSVQRAAIRLAGLGALGVQ